MYARKVLPPELLRLARYQDGVLSCAQVAQARVADSQLARLVRQQVLTRLDRGIYLLGPGSPTWRQYVWAAWLLGGHGARLMGTTAGAPFNHQSMSTYAMRAFR